MKTCALLLSSIIIMECKAVLAKEILFQSEKVLPTISQRESLRHQFNFIPINKLRIIEQELDSIISAGDCYKFIHNADTTKFLAFFIQHRNLPFYSRLTHFGQVVHRQWRPSENDSIKYYGYVVWGMKHEQNWYYNKDREYEFWDRTDSAGKDDFLFFVLDDINFFKKKNTTTFWKTGGRSDQFKTLSKKSYYLQEYAGLPEIVGWHKVSEGGRHKQIMNEEVEKITCSIQDNLWNMLHQSDSLSFRTRYKGEYMDAYCMVLYNPDRNKILLPMLYFDKQHEAWLAYYFLTITPAESTLYVWKLFPSRKVSEKNQGHESLEIISDIRTFIPNWGWGTVNMISHDNFWSDNFKEDNLQLIPGNVR